MVHDIYNFPKKQTNPFVSQPNVGFQMIVIHCFLWILILSFNFSVHPGQNKNFIKAQNYSWHMIIFLTVGDLDAILDVYRLS